MLTEELRIIAGLQESKIVENPLPKLIKENEQKKLKEQQRILNEKKTVISNFDLFEEKITKYKDMITLVAKILESEKSKVFLNGLLENKYNSFKKFADIVINDDFSTAVQFLEKNYYFLKEDIEKIDFLVEKIDESKAESYFVSNTLVSKDRNHDITFNLYKNKDLTEKVSTEVEYGSNILLVNDFLSIVKINGKKYYSDLSKSKVDILLKKNYLI